MPRRHPKAWEAPASWADTRFRHELARCLIHGWAQPLFGRKGVQANCAVSSGLYELQARRRSGDGHCEKERPPMMMKRR